MIARAVAETYDFSDIKRLADIGGGRGDLLVAIVDRHPGVQGVLVERPEVLERAQAHLADLVHRIEPVATDFVEQVPTTADACIIKNVLHDWSDRHCVRLLRNCRRALIAKGRVLIVEEIVSDAPEAALVKLRDLDLLMLTVGGRKRTEAEFATLLEEAGLRLSRVVPIVAPVCVLEAIPA